MILSPFLFGEKLTIYKIAGFLSVLVGVVFINGNIAGGGDGFGIICGLSSAVMYSLMVIFNKKAKDITGLENAALQLFISFLTAAAFVGIKQGFSVNIKMADIPPILILGIVNTGIGCYFYFSSIGELPVQTVALCGYIEPLSAVLFSMLFLKESMLPLQFIGAAMIISGSFLGEYIGERLNMKKTAV